MNKPIILIDLGKLKNLYSGLGQISFQYGNALAAAKSSSLDFTYLVPSNFKGKFGDSVGYQELSFLTRHFPILNNLTGRYDLWHAIHQDSGYMPPENVPYLLTIHDLNFLEEKSYDNAARRLRRLQKKVDRASAITFISKFSESVAKQHLKINVPMEVIYNGIEPLDHRDKKKPAYLGKLDLKKTPLYFTVGVIKEKKNFHVLISFMKKLGNGILVIAGDNSDAYARSMQSKIDMEKLNDRIIMPGIIPDTDRTWLYENCDAFFFPSKVEGFGLPVIEAMSYGKPVFLSNFSSLPEVGGTEAFYWENFNPDYMVAVFTKYIMSALTPEKIKSRKKRAAFFNWETAVRNYINLYEKIINGKL